NQSPSYSPQVYTLVTLDNGFIKGVSVVNEHNDISALYYISKSTETASYAAGQLLPQWEATIPSDVRVYTGSWTWTPNSTWLNDFRAGYSFLHASTFSGDAVKTPVNPWPQGYGMN